MNDEGARVVVQLVGPGGAGKSTVGALLASLLCADFVDLDRDFSRCFGDIGAFILQHGYDAYAAQNVATCASVLAEASHACVVALSSGFMTYRPDVHPDYANLRDAIDRSPGTFVLVPSLARERCVAETVRRQLSRPFARSAAREEAVIRARFDAYMALRPQKVETMRPAAAVVADILFFLEANARERHVPMRR